jgi:adenine-specific DNA-methyltransferase
LLKNKIVELGLKLDKELIKLLLTDEKIKGFFFKDIDGVLVFDKEKFIKFIDNKEFLPDSYTTFKNKIGLAADGNYIAKSKEVVLVWPYKDCILEGGQEEPDEKRREIFYNEILAPDEIDRLLDPKVFTNFKRIDKNGEHEVKDFRRDKELNRKRGLPEDTITDNLIIKGNNLLVLHSLKKQFAGKVKLIYIDPPYNTGNDEFKYNDRFNHYTWLTFMKNRLEVAKELLKEDGVIFVQCDDNEVAHLKILMDEIFKTAPSGKHNFVQYVEIKANVGAANEYQNPFMPKNCEYCLIYAKNYDKRKYKPIWVKSAVDRAYDKIILNPEEKDWTKWKIGKVMEEFVKEYGEENRDNEELLYEYVFKNINRIFRTISPKGAGTGLREAMEKSKKNVWAVYERDDKENILCYRGGMVRFYSKNLKKDIDGNIIIGTELGSLWTDISWQGIAPEGGVKLKSGKKPEKLLRRIIEMSTEPGDIVLDFFLGSGTTAAVAHKMGRQYIGVEQLDYGENSAIVRLKNVINGDQTGISKSVNWQGGGDFIYMELMKLNEHFIEKIQDAKDKETLLSIWEEIKLNGFLSYRVDPKLFDENIEEFKGLSIDEQKRLLLETLDKNYLYVNYTEIGDEMYKVKDVDKKLNKKFYGGNKDA